MQTICPCFYRLSHDATIKSFFEVLQDLTPAFQLAELFEVYQSCRRSKRNTLNALAFELDYESNFVTLCAALNNGSYQPGQSIAFIVDKPVKREIFAADFRDRVVHHLLVNKLNPLFEKALSTIFMPAD